MRNMITERCILSALLHLLPYPLCTLNKALYFNLADAPRGWCLFNAADCLGRLCIVAHTNPPRCGHPCGLCFFFFFCFEGIAMPSNRQVLITAARPSWCSDMPPQPVRQYG